MTESKKNLTLLPGTPGRAKALRKKKAALSSVPLPASPDFSNLKPEDLNDPRLYINRELSWLEFNQRVLDQAQDSHHPLLERLKFLAITGSNLDEFFMVRMATILRKYRAGIQEITADGMTTEQQIVTIRERTKKMMVDQKECWSKALRPLLEQQGITILEIPHYGPKIQNYLEDYFHREIFPVLTPLAFDIGHPFPHISNLSMNFAVVLSHEGQMKFARVKIPSMLPRFVPIPQEFVPKEGLHFVFLEDVIKSNIQALFPGTEIQGIFLFRVIRDTDLVIQQDEADDLLESVEESLKQVRYGALSLLRVEEGMPPRVLEILAENFNVEEDVIVRTDDRMGFADWISLTKLPLPRLKDPPFVPRTLFGTEEKENLFERIKYQDFLIHHPYESFSSVETFLKAAVDDPHVVAIKMTLYRIGANSPLVDQLIEAADEGKQVAVLVELKARFDERNNIVWANRLEAVGVHVAYGMLNLKTHSKLCLVVRKEGEGVRRYVHIATGNYNRQTAQVYTDLGLFTANPQIAEDVSEVFNFLTGYSCKRDFNRLLVAPINLRQDFLALIEREADHARQGRPARIMLKNNHVADQRMIQALYRASQAGVKIDMITRGVCCLRPGIPGISEGIRVISILGRFLEHDRIYYFQNNGEEEIYIGSADLMERNLDHRVETLVPVLSAELRTHLKNVILENMLRDTDRAFGLKAEGTYTRLQPSVGPAFNSQLFLLNQYTSKK